MSKYALNAIRHPVASVSMILLVIAVVVAGPASAHRMHLKDMIAESSVQRTIVWTLGAEIMRLALKIDEQGSLARLRASHEQFGQSLVILRQGVDELQERDADNSDAMAATLAGATRQWIDMDLALQPVWDSGAIGVGQSRELLELNRQIGQSIDQILTHFDQAANHYGVVTVIGKAIMATEQERALGQRIAADFMAVALHSDATDQAALSDSVAQFDRLLRALQYGDPTLGLIPPPTAELRQKLTEIEGIWREMAPQLRAAAAGDPLTRVPVDRFAALSADLFAGLGAVKEILTDLVPAGRG